MKFVLPCCDYDYKLGMKSGVINGGTVWLDNIAHALRDAGHQADLVSTGESKVEADVMIIQSEWTGTPVYLNFTGKKVVLLGHFIKHHYPDPKTIKADLLITMWKGDCVKDFNTYFIPHAYSDLTDNKKTQYKGDIIWCGNKYPLRDENWLEELPLTNIKGVMPQDLFGIYRGANVVCNLHGNFQKNIISTDDSKIADKPCNMINERFWNAIGGGAVLVTDYTQQMSEFFNDDELIVGRDKDDFQAKVLYFNEHKKEGLEILKKARERILKEHTYKNRVHQLLQLL